MKSWKDLYISLYVEDKTSFQNLGESIDFKFFELWEKYTRNKMHWKNARQKGCYAEFLVELENHHKPGPKFVGVPMIYYINITLKAVWLRDKSSFKSLLGNVWWLQWKVLSYGRYSPSDDQLFRSMTCKLSQKYCF